MSLMVMGVERCFVQTVWAKFVTQTVVLFFGKETRSIWNRSPQWLFWLPWPSGSMLRVFTKAVVAQTSPVVAKTSPLPTSLSLNFLPIVRSVCSSPLVAQQQGVLGQRKPHGKAAVLGFMLSNPFQNWALLLFFDAVSVIHEAKPMVTLNLGGGRKKS